MFCQFTIEGIIKGVHEESDKGRHRMRSGKVPKAGTSVLVELECVTLLTYRCVYQPRGSLNPIFWEFYGGFITYMEARSIINPVFSPSGE